MNSKKEKEKVVISKFLRACQFGYRLLDTEEAKRVFENYNGENPNFIIAKGSEYKGVELFQLSLSETKNALFQVDESGKRRYINLPHKERLKINERSNELYEQEDIGAVLKERISDKIKKLALYVQVTPRVWLLGYATESYNMCIVRNIFEDRIDDVLRQFIFREVEIPEQIEKIFLFESSDKDIIFEIK
jgi:hypothetical protein